MACRSFGTLSRAATDHSVAVAESKPSAGVSMTSSRLPSKHAHRKRRLTVNPTETTRVSTSCPDTELAHSETATEPTALQESIAL